MFGSSAKPLLPLLILCDLGFHTSIPSDFHQSTWDFGTVGASLGTNITNMFSSGLSHSTCVGSSGTGLVMVPMKYRALVLQLFKNEAVAVRRAGEPNRLAASPQREPGWVLRMGDLAGLVAEGTNTKRVART